MTLSYFLTDDPASGALAGPEGRHAVTVKRITPGERIALVDGRGTRAEVLVRSVEGKDRLAGEVLSVETFDPPTPRITVVQAIPKSDRAELAVDLAVQGGADEIVPWMSQRTIARWPAEKRAKQVAKWQATAREAAKQSRRVFVPEVKDPLTTAGLRGFIGDRQALVLHEGAVTPLKTVSFAPEVVLIVGPEGGIGEDELEGLGALPVRLGPQVLRTASAAFAALAAIGAMTERW